jgi:putative metallopeptidase
MQDDGTARLVIVGGDYASALADAYPVPSDDTFDDEGSSGFLPAADLAALARQLCERYDELHHLRRARLVILWKKRGGKKAGQEVWGTCQKPSGLVAHFADADFVVTLSADHLREASATASEVEAALFHELKHASYDLDDNGEIVWTTRGHDYEGFRAEVERYGLWRDGLKVAAQTFNQLALPA